MTAKTPAALTIALLLAGAGALAQAPITRAQSVSGTATIQAIDSKARTVTLRDEQGQQETYTVGPQVKRFDEFKVGDKVKISYYESVVLQVRKPGETAQKPGAPTTDVEAARGQGPLPGAGLAVQDKMTVTVKAIDPAAPSITVTTPDGLTVTRKVENKKNIEGLKAGDQIDITVSRALLAEIERAK
jgi:Cu/Ag efflux protein CusF